MWRATLAPNCEAPLFKQQIREGRPRMNWKIECYSQPRQEVLDGEGRCTLGHRDSDEMVLQAVWGRRLEHVLRCGAGPQRPDLAPGGFRRTAAVSGDAGMGRLCADVRTSWAGTRSAALATWGRERSPWGDFDKLLAGVCLLSEPKSNLG